MFVNLITGGIAKTLIAIKPGILPSPNNITTGIRYTKLGIVCIKSSMGKMILCAKLFFAINIPIGILMAKNNLAHKIILPILDLMQTIPSFVYLIPVVMLFGLGKIPGLIAISVFAIPPVIRFTNIGLREVNKDLRETAQALGLKSFHILRLVELSLARNVILGGINQTIMMALAMVVIASMIGVRGLGAQVLNSIGNGYLGLGVISGLSIVALAIIIDRAIQSHNKRYDKWRDYK